MENSNKSSTYFLTLVIVSVLVAISPIIIALIYGGLDYTGIMPLPDGFEALSFAMLFTVPAGAILFFVGSVILFLLHIRRKSLLSIEEHMKNINETQEEKENT